MLRHTFLLLESISYGKESLIWKQGIRTWADFLARASIEGISAKRKLYYDRQLRKAGEYIHNANGSYFSSLLPQREHWRCFNQFSDEVVYLDIETSHVATGDITCLTLYDGYDCMTFVKGINFNPKEIGQLLKRYSMVVTFNGSVFDLPFLRKKYPGLLPDMLCWDLRHSCAELGLTGGLKEIEKKLGLVRKNDIVTRLKGGDPLKLWKMYFGSQDPYYLELLIEYNKEDTINLEDIARIVYKKLSERLEEKIKGKEEKKEEEILVSIQ